MGSEIDSVAVETATRKRPPEPSSAVAEVSPKRPCAGTDSDDDSFEEFYALLQRIEATDRHCFRSREVNRQVAVAKSMEPGKVDDAKAVTTHASWWPSFEWEDFSARGNGTCDVKSKAGERNFKAARERERERERVSPEASLDGEKTLDLNLPLELMPL